MTGILIIGGYDPTGSAGVLQDVCIIKSFNIPSFAIVSAFVYENTCRVTGVAPLEVNKQLQLANEERLEFKVVKIGLVYDRKQLDEIANYLTEKKPDYIVYDPVRVSSTDGVMSSLKEEDVLEFMKKFSPILTPNKTEFIELFGKLEPLEAAKKYNTTILFKSIEREDSQITDVLATPYGTVKKITHKDFMSSDVHGTGCTISSLLSVFLYMGFSIEKAYITALREFEKRIKNTAKFGCQRVFI